MYVVTFYSFKGGVGRSMAMMNVAIELVRRGRRVLAVDFDLEAPGLDTFELASNRNHTPGIVEYVTEYLTTGIAPDVRQFVYNVHDASVGDGSLWVMPSGADEDTYSQRLCAIDWDDLYRNRDGYLFLEDLKAQWRKTIAPDYVLIDSRTGHTDVGGICTRQLPDAVVVQFFPNEQNLRGLRKVVGDIREDSTDGVHSTHLHFVMSNVPVLDDEDGILERTLTSFRDELGFTELTETIHRYDSLSLLQQALFVRERPQSRLAREYCGLVHRIIEQNIGDREGVLLWLNVVGMKHGGFDSSKEFDDKIALIADRYATDGEVIFRSAQIYRRRQQYDEWSNFIDRAFHAGYVTPELLVSRAEVAMIKGDAEVAIASIKSVIARHDATDDARISAIGLLHKSALLDLARSTDVGRLSVKVRVRIAGKLAASIEELRVARSILSDAKSDIDARIVLSLSLIGLGRFDEAIDLLSQDRRPMERMNVHDQFNYAMACWGRDGVPTKELFAAFLKKWGSPRPASANALQCEALANWVIGRGEIASEILRQSRVRVGTEYDPFSCWRYLKVSLAEFRRDIDEMDTAFSDGHVVPRFVERGSTFN